MKFVFRQFTNKGLSIVGQTNGDWNDFAEEAVNIWKKENTSAGEQYPLAGLIDCIMDNYSSDYDLVKENLNWEDYLDGSSEILDCNSPFVYDGRNQQIMSFNSKAYDRINDLVKAECKAFFNNEEYVYPTITKRISKGSGKGIKVKATYPGVYKAPIKSNPNRWVANYRLNNQTIKIGYFNSEQEAIQAKKAIVNK